MFHNVVIYTTLSVSHTSSSMDHTSPFMTGRCFTDVLSMTSLCRCSMHPHQWFISVSSEAYCLHCFAIGSVIVLRPRYRSSFPLRIMHEGPVFFFHRLSCLPMLFGRSIGVFFLPGGGHINRWSIVEDLSAPCPDKGAQPERAAAQRSAPVISAILVNVLTGEAWEKNAEAGVEKKIADHPPPSDMIHRCLLSPPVFFPDLPEIDRRSRPPNGGGSGIISGYLPSSLVFSGRGSETMPEASPDMG